ncbi:unnamed protein product [Adineta steineri]|uniref:Methyltransferase-like protein n=1 Tax=Adineta steineri TaxID=433720 RepID=A0A814ATF9_9BILA|nr:unnamed protein product [Adineta steineri]CAF1469157.1 unnamed protein product [Adineta steineri]CAF3648889.1 unnamed protein product [Adineta steineri]CAF3732825.1 unnamed protein product [Adineta steineri]
MSGDTTGELYFFSHTIDDCPPWVDATPALGDLTSNFIRTPTHVTIHDLRGKENSVDLDTNGFEILKYNGSIHDEFDNDSEMQRHCYEEIAALLKKRLGASRVIIFNHVFRFRAVPRAADQCDENRKNPVYFAHVDNDPPGARLKVQQVLGEEEAKKVMQKRFQIINVWRPVGPNPIINIPLTICDYRSLDIDKDIHRAETRGSSNSSTNYMISCNTQDAQRWCYLSYMRSDEMFIFKIFDSNPESAQFGAHTAFINEHASQTDVEQKSLEIRCLVLYDE